MQVNPNDLLCIFAACARQAFLDELGQLADLRIASMHEDHGSLRPKVVCQGTFILHAHLGQQRPGCEASVVPFCHIGDNNLI